LCDKFSGACSWALLVLCGVFVLEHFQHYVVNSSWQFWHCVVNSLVFFLNAFGVMSINSPAFVLGHFRHYDEFSGYFDEFSGGCS
ncbi:9789_t:CDS:2, partial [Dentiscutata heterogama]